MTQPNPLVGTLSSVPTTVPAGVGPVVPLGATSPALPVLAGSAAAAPSVAVVDPGPQAPFIAKLTIFLFVIVYLGGALWLLLDFWVLEQVHLRRLIGVAPDHVLSPMALSAMHAMLGAVLGAGVLDIVSFHRYVSVKGDFQARHVWGYFVAPLLAGVLGLVVFALLQSGLLVFAGGAKGEGGDAARLGYLAVGFLAGFGWHEATQSIERIVKRFFGNEVGATAAAQRQPSAPVAAPPPVPPAH